MNPTAIYSKSGKGVQEASGKTSLLQRADRAVLSAVDGRATLADVAQKVGKPFDAAFEKLITQLDKDGFIREVSAGAAAPAPPAKPAAKPAAKAPAANAGGADLDFSSLGAPSRPANPPSRPAAPPPKPAAPAPNFAQLDFSTLGTHSKPAATAAKPAAAAAPGAAKEQQSALAKAREKAEARAQAERDRLKAEVEAKTRTELEAKMRAEAEQKMKDEAAAKEAAAAKAAAEAEAKAKAAREAAVKAAAAKVKAEAEAKAKLEAERKAREELERRLEEERKAREEAERKAKEEAERARKEAEEKARREAEELRQRLEEERKAREEAERKAKEEAERVRRELEEERKRLEAERKREEAERAERRKREEEEAQARRKQREEEERRESEAREAKRRKEEEQAAALLAAAKAREAAKPPAPKPEPSKPQSFGDSLLADLDSFTNRDDEDRKAREEGERKAKEEAERRTRDEAERQAKEEAELARVAEEDRRRQEEQARRAREDEERRAQEDERRKRETDEIRRKAAAATAAAMAKEGRSTPKEDDIPISVDDLHMDEVKREQAALAKTQAKEKEVQKERERAAMTAERRVEAQSIRIRKPIKWGSLIVTTLIVFTVASLITLHVVPAPVSDYERSAAEALGRPVKIGSGHYWLLTGPAIHFSDVRIGDARIAAVAASISFGSIFGERKEFTRVELDGLKLPQESLGEALFAKVKADNLVVDRIVVKSLELPGPAVMPKSLQADVLLDGNGALRTATLRGPDGLVAKIVPKEGAVEFDVIAGGFTLPIAPEITLSKFAMKGSATSRGMKVDEWGGAIFNGGISGTASVRWGGTWLVEGVVTVRGINAAVFAPALVSTGTGEGTGRFSMTGADPAKLASTGRIDGNFTVTQGTLGSFDLAKGIQTSGKQAMGTTSFTEMTGQAVYDRGAVALRNVNIGAGALNAAASADITQAGALSGRIVADVKTANRSQQATIVLGGTVKEPQVRN